MNATMKKLLIIGDGNTGKTSLLIAFTQDKFEDCYVPTLFDYHESTIKVDNTDVLLALWDSTGQQNLDFLRPMCYPDMDVILISFTIDSRTSLENVLSKWVPEVKMYTPDVPIVLVGNKIDLRDNNAKTIRDRIRYEEGVDMAAAIKAHAYVECSAKTKENVLEVFMTATIAALYPMRNQRKICCYLL